MKKPIVIIALTIFIAIGIVSILYATGNLGGIVNKIFNRSEKVEIDNKTEEELFESKLESCNAEYREKSSYLCYVNMVEKYPDKIQTICDKVELKGDECVEFFTDWKNEGFMTSPEKIDLRFQSLRVVRKTARDITRKFSLEIIVNGIKMYHRDYGYYPISNEAEKVNSKESVLYKKLKPYFEDTNIEIPIDSLYPEFYYTYESDGFVYTLTARLENLEDESCVTENDICLYSLKGGNPAPDYEKVEEIKDKCRGSLEIIDKKCADGKLEMKVKVSTTGDCPVVSFIVDYADNKKKIAEFSSLGDNDYLVVLDNCNEVEKLIASGEGGFTIGN